LSIAFCVSGGGRVVGATLAARAAGLLTLQDATAVLDRPTPFSEVAANYGIGCTVLDHRHFENKEQFRDELTRTLEKLAVDHLFLTFDWLLSAEAVSTYQNRIINLHMSQLPLFPGRGAIKAALAAGTRTAGVTYHFVDNGVDTGPIIAQAITAVVPRMTHEQLGRALFKRAVPLAIQVLRWLEQSRLHIYGPLVSVSEALYDDGPYFPALDDDIAEFSRNYLARWYPG